MSGQGEPQFNPADMPRAQLEEIVAKARIMARLTADYLYHLGHRPDQVDSARRPTHPAKALATLHKLDTHLAEMEEILGLEKPGKT